MQKGEVKFISPSQAAEKLGVSTSRIHALLAEDRIPESMKVGRGKGSWCIPLQTLDGQEWIEVKGPSQRNRKFSKIN